MLTERLHRLMRREAMSRKESEEFIAHVLQGASEHQVAACLALLHAKGETADELAGMVDGMRHAQLPVALSSPALDIVGTGGDMAGSVNISSGAAILARACGVPIAKNGNRSATSRCGSADVLEELGVIIDLSVRQAERCFERTGIVFLFAPSFHPAMKRVVPIRRALRVPTAFNFLGPLLNPATPGRLVIGVANPSIMEVMAEAAKALGIEHALIVHGSGLDELTPLGPVEVIEVTQEGCQRWRADPAELGFAPCELSALKGGDAQRNARLLTEALGGEASPIADALIFTAAAGLYVFGEVKDLADGVATAREVQRSGRALTVLSKWVTACKHIAEEGS